MFLTALSYACVRWYRRRVFAAPGTVMPLLSRGRRSRWWQAVASTWRRYLAVTTIPGLQNVHHSKGVTALVVWGTLFLLGLVCTAQDVYTVTADYLSYPVTTVMTVDQVATLAFPAVTVCNLNRVHCANLQRMMTAQRETEEASNMRRLHTLASCQEERRGRQRRQQDTDAAPTTVTPMVDSTNQPPPGQKALLNQTRSFDDLMNFMVVYMGFSQEMRSKMGHGFSQFILGCTFSGKSCYNQTQFFVQSLTSGYGNCFTFITDRRTIIPGKDYGLSMELYLDQSNYLGGGLSPQGGARVVVHDPKHQPLPEETGVTVAPGVASSVALLQVHISRQRLPYATNCSSSWERTWYSQQVNGAYIYSSERCQRICLQLTFEEKCNCSHPSYIDLDTGYFPCNLTSSSESYRCATDILYEFESRQRECSCNMDCSEITFETRISSSTWPTSNDWCAVAEQYSLVEGCDVTSQEPEAQATKRKVQGNLLRIEVYFETLRVKSIFQNPTYKAQTYVGSLGGALSLYLGVTLLMLLEVLEVGGRLVFTLVRHYWGKMAVSVTRRRHHKLYRGRHPPPRNLNLPDYCLPANKPALRGRMVW